MHINWLLISFPLFQFLWNMKKGQRRQRTRNKLDSIKNVMLCREVLSSFLIPFIRLFQRNDKRVYYRVYYYCCTCIHTSLLYEKWKLNTTQFFITMKKKWPFWWKTARRSFLFSYSPRLTRMRINYFDFLFQIYKKKKNWMASKTGN